MTLDVLPLPLSANTLRKSEESTHPDRALSQTHGSEAITADLTECPETDLDGLSHRAEPCTLRDPKSIRFARPAVMITGSNLTGVSMV